MNIPFCRYVFLLHVDFLYTFCEIHMACERPRVLRLMHVSVPKCQLPDEAGSYTTEKMLTEDLSYVEDWFELPKPYSQQLPAISTPNQKHQTTLRGTCSIRAVQLYQRISNLGRNKLPTT